MKFGDFARKNNIGKDTLRYYIKEGLVLPEKNGGQYSFTKDDKEDLEFILDLKDFDFSIEEINKLISLKRNLHPSDYRFNTFMAAELDKKKLVLEEKIKTFKERLGLLESKKESYLKKAKNYQKLGIAISFLDYLACPNCKCQFNLTSARIEENYIMSAKLTCPKCKESLSIDDGIIVEDGFKDQEVSIEDLPIKENKDYWLGTHLGMDWKELKNLNQYEFQRVYLAYQRMYDELLETDFPKSSKKPCFMTSEINSGRFLFFHLLNKLADDNPIKKSPIIVALGNLGVSRKLKTLLENLGLRLNIAIICAPTDRLPIRDSSVDIFIDDYSSFYYLLREGTILLDDKRFTSYMSDSLEVFGIIPKDFFMVLDYKNIKTKNSKFLTELSRENDSFYLHSKNFFGKDENSKVGESVKFMAYHYSKEGKLRKTYK